MRVYESKFERTLQKAIAERRQTVLENLGAGVEAEKYRYWVGYILALDDIANCIEDVRRKLNTE